MQEDTTTALDKPNQNQFIQRLAFYVGILGMCLLIAGNFVPPSTTRQLCFVIGATLMTVTAWIRGDVFFTTLQCVVIAGALMAFTSFSPIVKAIIPAIFAITGVSFFAIKGAYEERIVIVGTIGMCILSLGYALAHPLIYCFGGFFLAIYSGIAWSRGNPIASLWFILNVIFTISAAYNSYLFFTN